AARLRDHADREYLADRPPLAEYVAASHSNSGDCRPPSNAAPLVIAAGEPRPDPAARRLTRYNSPRGYGLLRTHLLFAGWIGVLSAAVVSGQAPAPARITPAAAISAATTSPAPADAAGQRAIVNQYCVP